MTTSREGANFGEKERELIAVAASVAAGCQPCTRFHIRVAGSAGASEDEILGAVRDATRVRLEATSLMARAGGVPLAEGSAPALDLSGAPTRLRQLVSIAAAYAVNCATSLAAYLDGARALGATDDEMLAAIEIASAVRKVAIEKARAVAAATLRLTAEQTAGCECAEDVAAEGRTSSRCEPEKTCGPESPCRA